MEKLLGKVLAGDTEQHSGQGASPNPSKPLSHENDLDLHDTADHAASHTNDDTADFFYSILNQLGPKKQQIAQEGSNIDEEAAIRHHKDFYGPSPMSSSAAPSATSTTIGTAAAMQALKLFTSGELTQGGQGQSTSQSAFVGLAMSQAAKLFDRQASAGNLESSEDKESAVMKAGEMALKMFLQSQKDTASGSKFPGAGAGPAGLGGSENQLGGLLDLAGKLIA